MCRLESVVERALHATFSPTLLYNANYTSNAVTVGYAAYRARLDSSGTNNGGAGALHPTNFPGRVEIIGDTVNLAARLESKTKDLHRSLVMSEGTATFLNGDYELVPLGLIEVKGKTLKVNAFAIGSNGGPKA